MYDAFFVNYLYKLKLCVCLFGRCHHLRGPCIYIVYMPPEDVSILERCPGKFVG